MVSNKFLAGIVALFCAASAQAAPIPLTTTIAANGHLASGAGQTFQFNVNSLLADMDLTSGAISTGQLTVYGSSAANYTFIGTTTDSTTKTGSSWHTKPGACNNGRCTVEDETWLIQTTKNYRDDVKDQMWVKAGDASQSDSTDWNQIPGSYGAATYTGYSGNQRDGWDYFYTSSRTFSSGYSGDLSVTLNLDAKAITDLAQDGILSLYVWAGSGQFDINSMTLSFSAEEVPAPAQGEVPVPTSLLLTGLGLAALGMARRRKA